MTSTSVLIVDDHRDMANGIAMLLDELSLDVTVADSARAALAHLERRPFALIVSDVRMPRVDGVQLLDEIRTRWPRTQVVLLTAYGTIDSAVDAMKRGASDYLTKPFDNRDLIKVVKRCLARAAAGDDLDEARIMAAVTAVLSPDDLFGSLAAALDVLRSATGADDAELFLLEPDGRDALLTIWTGPDSDVLVERTRFEPNVGYPGIVASTAAPVAVQGHLADDPRYLRAGVIARGIRSYACVPLSERQRPLGSIHLLSRRDDFPVQRVIGLLERAAVPITNALRAGLAALRQEVDRAAADHPEGSPAQVRALLDCIRHAAGASHATLALVDPATGLPAQVISTSPATLICSHAQVGAWASCPSLAGVHGFAAERRRRGWPINCRHGLPHRVASPCCLPLAANGRLHGLITFDLGRRTEDSATSRLVPLLVMAQQAAARLAPHHPGLPLEAIRTGAAPRTRAAPAAELELRCLGPFEIFRGGTAVTPEQFPRAKALVLLELLALHAGTPLTKDYLIEQLWPGADPESGANRLHGVVHALRHVIEPQRPEQAWRFVRNRGDVYYLDTAAPIEIDLLRFRRLLERARAAIAARPEEAIDALEQAVALYRGDLFADDPYAEWCQSERRELQERQVDALARLARLHATHDDLGPAADHVRAALRLAPYRVDLLRWLIERLTQSGRADEARAIDDEFRHAVGAGTDLEESSSDPDGPQPSRRASSASSPAVRVPERGRRGL